jgi:lantibiotic modifying enzyme
MGVSVAVEPGAIESGAIERVATAIADVLVETAVVAGDRCTWLSATVEMQSGRRVVLHRTANPSFYGGDAGIAWALSHAGRALERSDLGALAVAGARNAIHRIDRIVGPGLYDGAAGVAVVALDVGTSLDERDLVRDGLELLHRVIRTSPEEDDLVSGAAGILLATLAGSSITGETDLLEDATALGRLLEGRARRYPWGWGWPGVDGVALCGLAHGASGIGWALAELEAASGREPSVGEAVHHALRFERSWLDRSRSNWPDLRPGLGDLGQGSTYPTWWCHGGAGVGLARLRIHELGDPAPMLIAEAATAMQSSLAAGARLTTHMPIEHGLTTCHGLGGVLELLLEAHRVLGEPEHLASSRWLVARALSALGPDVERWPDGLGTVADPGLMTGLAGVMLTLLQVADPGSVPSVGLFPRTGRILLGHGAAL